MLGGIKLYVYKRMRYIGKKGMRISGRKIIISATSFTLIRVAQAVLSLEDDANTNLLPVN